MNRDRSQQIILMAILLCGLFLRFYGIDSKPFQEDESWTLLQRDDLFNPPLYYFLVKLITKVLGVSELSLRLLSAIGSSLSIWLVYKVGEICKSPRVGLIAAALMAISPLSIVYAQMARSYGLFEFWAILSLYILIQYFETRRISFFIAFFICTFLGLSTHFLYASLLIADVIFFLFLTKKLGRRELIKWLIACVILMLLFLPSYWTALSQWQKETTGNQPFALWVRILMAFFSLTLGETTYPFNWKVVVPAALFFGSTFAAGIYSCVRNQQKGGFLILLRLMFPLSVWLLLGDDRPRHLSYAVCFFLLIIAIGVEKLATKPTWKTLWVSFLIIPQGVSSYYWYSSNAEQILNANLIIPWKEIVSDLRTNRKPQETVLLHPAFHFDFIQYYSPEESSNFLLLSEVGYGKILKNFLDFKPETIWLLTPPNTSRTKKIRMEYFSCYEMPYHKGYVLNPRLTQHFQTGKKEYLYAAQLYHLQRRPNCLEEIRKKTSE